MQLNTKYKCPNLTKIILATSSSNAKVLMEQRKPDFWRGRSTLDYT